jgi:hypothetical protein
MQLPQSSIRMPMGACIPLRPFLYFEVGPTASPSTSLAGINERYAQREF